MELRHLRYFLMVAEELNFTKAAEKLFTAQPSLSQQIRDLEQEVGVLLFERTARKVRLTEEGQAFLVHANNAIESSKLAMASARQVAHRKNNQIYIGFLNVAELKLMPNILKKLKSHIPELKIHLQSLTCLEQIQRLKNAELDITFTRYEIQHPDFDNIHILNEQLYLVASSELHPSERILKFQEFKNHNMIMCEENSSPVLYEKLSKIYSFEKHLQDQMFWVTNVLQHINLINMGIGFSFVPEYLLKFLNPEVKIIETDIALPSLGLYASFAKNNQSRALAIICDALSKEHSLVPS